MVQLWRFGQKSSEIRRRGGQRFETHSTRIPHAGKNDTNSWKRKNLEVVETSRFFVGGDKRDRTADLLNAIQALSQLSYTPRCFRAGAPRARSILPDPKAFVKNYFFFFQKSLTGRAGIGRGEADGKGERIATAPKGPRNDRDGGICAETKWSGFLLTLQRR